MKLKMAPTRGNLVKAARATVLAQKGHDLLEQKRQVLMMELMRHMDAAKSLQKDMASVFSSAYESLQRANVSLGIDTVEEIAQSVPVVSNITVRLRSVMGVEIPEVDPVDPTPTPSYSFHGSSSAMDKAYVRAREVLSLLARLAEVETSVYRLAVQVRKTYRRVNALEKVVIPSNREAMAAISDVLDEGEREDFVRMKIAKEHRPGGR